MTLSRTSRGRAPRRLCCPRRGREARWLLLLAREDDPRAILARVWFAVVGRRGPGGARSVRGARLLPAGTTPCVRRLPHDYDTTRPPAAAVAAGPGLVRAVGQ